MIAFRAPAPLLVSLPDGWLLPVARAGHHVLQLASLRVAVPRKSIHCRDNSAAAPRPAASSAAPTNQMNLGAWWRLITLGRYLGIIVRRGGVAMAVQLPGSVAYGTSREGPPRSSHTIKCKWVSCGSPKPHPITSSSYTGSHRGLRSLACKLAASSLTLALSQPRVPTRPYLSANCPKNSLLMMK